MEKKTPGSRQLNGPGIATEVHISDQALFLQSRERGLRQSLTRTHYSAGRGSALFNMPSQMSVFLNSYNIP
jgi:hypothetical protein